MIKKLLTLITFLFLGAHFACAAMDANDVRKAQQYDPGFSQFEDNLGFGNVIYGYIGVTGNGSLAATSNGVVPVTLKTLTFSANGTGFGGGNIGMTLPNGSEGQALNINLATDANSGILIITPATKTGFSYLVFSAAGQGCQLTYVDSNGQITPGSNSVGKTTGTVTGWVPTGCYSASASVQPVVHQ